MAPAPAWRLFAVVALAVFAVDQASKILVIEALGLPEAGRIDVAPPYLVFLMGWNEGINFGLFGDASLRWPLVAIAVGLSVAIAAWVLRRGEAWMVAGGALVVGGALGNALDRVVWGAVADFINMSCCGIRNPYAFNLADVAIFAGAAVIAWRA